MKFFEITIEDGVPATRTQEDQVTVRREIDATRTVASASDSYRDVHGSERRCSRFQIPIYDRGVLELPKMLSVRGQCDRAIRILCPASVR